MKKRIISLLMVALMLVSLVPMGALAAGNTTITKQPSDKSAAVGETVTFEIAATNPNSTDLEYLWFDADEAQKENIDISDLSSDIKNKLIISKLKAEGVKLGEGQTLELVAERDMNIRCVVYYIITIGEKVTVEFPKDLALSNTVTLTVTGGTVDPDPTTCDHDIKIVNAAEANCTAKAHSQYWQCSKCGQIFADAAGTKTAKLKDFETGKKDETKHTDLKHFPSKAATCTEKGNIEYWYCSGCKEYYSDAAGTVKTTLAKVSTSKNDHDYYWVADEVAGVHYQKCRVCGTTTGTSSHSGGTASCKAQAKCAKCGASYGELDPNTHVNFEVRNEVKATETKQGYTGDKYCKDCGKLIETGEYYSAQCAGGRKDIELVKGTPKTCTEDGTIDYYRCKKCGNMYKDERASILITKDDLVDKCTGHDLHPGTDLVGSISQDNLKLLAKTIGLSTPQIVQMIRDGTFDLDHIIGMIKIKDIDHCSDDTYHWLGCQRCGKTLEDLRDELNSAGFEINEKWYELSRKTAHTGGTATCTEKAVCDECGDAYGELGAHRYDAVVTAPTCTQNGYTKHTCSSCKDSYTDNETVKTGHIIKYGVCEKCNMRFSNPFYDVNGTDWFYSAVMWAYYNTPQVTNGKDESHFAPKASCTRAQVVTFLWRAAGRPEPSGSVKQFSDVPKNNSYAYCYDAILWAVENGITKGTDATHFSPNATVTRAQFVTFLWRYAGEPAPKNMSCGFNDVDANAFYYKAVLWAVENGVTTGKTATQFAPGATCTRCEVAAFMFRAFSKGITAK
jgi:hypothetical protein|nr:MAG TPA: S-layer homology domain [Caudoviricetes sp.]